jgi:type I restriction enzyme M protein
MSKAENSIKNLEGNLNLFNPLNIQKIKQGVSLGLFKIEDNYIYYLKSDNRKQKLTEKDPEELVRAEMYFDLVNTYKYDPEAIGVEISIMVGSTKKYADLIVYRTSERTEGNAFIVVECKKDEISQSEFEMAVKQGNSYARSQNADYSVTVSGKTVEVIKAVKNTKDYEELREETVGDIPVRYDKPSEWRFFKGVDSRDIQTIDKHALMRIFKKCNQTLWDGGQLNPLEAFDELSKLIFAKISDELAPRKPGEPYSFQIKSNEAPEVTFNRISQIYNKGLDRDEDVFKEPIKLDPRKLVAVVKHLEAINLNKTDLDSKGVAFESFMQDFFVGKAGQYFTPREVIEFIVDFLDFENTDRVLDPACGSSGFLLHALDKVRKQAGEYWIDDEQRKYSHWHDFASKNLYGIELNRSLARVSKMNMIIHDDGHTNVVASDALVPISAIESLNSGFKENSFDIVLSNPPFGASVSSSEKEYLKTYQLGVNAQTGKPRNTQKTEILFIERIWQFLKPGTGKAGIILPDGILTNSSLQYVRDFILEKFKLLAVVSLPQTAFSHYGAGVKTSVLFLEKWGKENELDKQTDYPIFMAKAENIGYDATGRKTGKSDLKGLKQQYEEFLKDPKPFFV